MALFKLLNGSHSFYSKKRKRGVDVRTYRAGDVIETDRPLDTQFKNKFIRIGESKPAEEASTGAEPNAPVVDDDDDDTMLIPIWNPVHRGRGQWQVVDGDGNVHPDSEDYLKRAKAHNLASDLNESAEQDAS